MQEHTAEGRMSVCHVWSVLFLLIQVLSMLGYSFKFWKSTNKGMGLFWTLGEFQVFSIVWVVVCFKLTAINIFSCEKKLKLNFFLIDYIYNPGVPDWAQGNLFFPTVMVTEHWHRLPRWVMAYPSPLEILKNHLDMGPTGRLDLLEPRGWTRWPLEAPSHLNSSVKL